MVGTPVSGNEAPGNDFITLYLAARILGVAGFDAVSTAKALREIYGAEVEPSEVERWFSTPPEAIVMKRALASFLRNLTKDKLWALRYVAGAIMGDGDQYGKLRVKDWLFIDVYAKALAVLTDDPNIRIRRTKDGRYYTKCFFLARYIRNGLWKVLAYLDHHDEIKHFLAGLFDAEGSLSPYILKTYKSLKIQLSFGNTNLELVKFVMESLRQLGLNPYLRVKQHGPQIVNGKLLVPRQPLYDINTRVPFSKVMSLTRVGFRCSREAKLFSFFISVKDLPPRLRYEAFMKNWKKVGGKWVPIHTPAEKRPRRSKRPRRTSAASNRAYVVQCPACKQKGTFTLHREVVGGKTLIEIRIHHENNACAITVAEKEVKEGEKPTMLVTCSKCGKPGYVYAFTHDFLWRKHYKYIRVGVCHHIDTRRTKTCLLKSLRLIDDATNTAENAEQPAPTPKPAR